MTWQPIHPHIRGKALNFYDVRIRTLGLPVFDVVFTQGVALFRVWPRWMGETFWELRSVDMS